MSDRLWIFLLFPGLPFLVLFLQMRSYKRRRADLELPLYQLRRPAGSSLQKMADEQWDRVTFGIACVMMTAIAPTLIFAGGASVWSALILGAIFCPLCLRQLWKDVKPLPNFRLGVIGEQATGGILDGLQREDVRVFHDLVISEHGHTRNIDHIVLTPTGLLCVETKGRRKKRRVPGEHWVLTFDGERVHFPDKSYDSSALEQTTGNAQWLHRRAHQLTGGETIPVWPVLVYPGWMIKRTGCGIVHVVSHRELHQLIPMNGPELSSRNLRILHHWLEQQCAIELPPDDWPSGKESHHSTGSREHPAAPALAG